MWWTRIWVNLESWWWTRIWVNLESWWWTVKPGVLQFMGLQKVRYDWATELNWTYPWIILAPFPNASTQFFFFIFKAEFLVSHTCVCGSQWWSDWVCLIHPESVRLLFSDIASLCGSGEPKLQADLWDWRAAYCTKEADFRQNSSLPWLSLCLLCCDFCGHLWNFKVVQVWVAALGFSYLCCACTHLSQEYACSHCITVGLLHLPTDSVPVSGHCLFLQINWVPSFMTKKLPILTAWPVPRIHQAGGRQNESRTERRRLSFLLPEVQLLLKHSSFVIVVNLVNFQNTNGYLCQSCLAWCVFLGNRIYQYSHSSIGRIRF